MTRTVVVFGAAGMLGRVVVRRLERDTRLQVGAVTRADSSPYRFDIELQTGSVGDLLDQCAPAAVVNCAGVLASAIRDTDPGAVRSANVVNGEFPHHLASWAEDHDCHVVHISTDGVFAPDAGRCFEDDQNFATDTYGVTKRLGESTSSAVVNLRTSIIGLDPINRRGLIEWCRSHSPGATVPGFVDQLWNGITTLELADVCYQLVVDEDNFVAARSDGPIHHVAADPPMTKADLIERVIASLRLRLSVERVESGRPITRVLGRRLPPIAGGLDERDVDGAIDLLANTDHINP